MVQEVQTQWNRYQTPNRIEWIWVSERKLSDHAQVRNKQTNDALFSGSVGVYRWWWEQFPTDRALVSWSGEYYKIIDWDIYISLAWAYLIEFYTYQWYIDSQNYNLYINVYSDNKVIYSETTKVNDHENKKFTANLWKWNRFRVGLENTDESSIIYYPFKIKFVKL